VEIFGLSITRRQKALGPASLGGGWTSLWPVIREPFTGAWQQGQEESVDTLLTHSAVYACVRLISSDVAKMRLRLVAQDKDGVWTETDNNAFSPVLRRPNRYQNRIQFFQWWIVSKLLHGNTYALKQRDQRGVVNALYILNPQKVRPLVAPDGSVFYQLGDHSLAGLAEAVVVPARELIHDVMVPLYHELCGVSPLHACATAAVQGLRIQSNSTRFFSNGSRPGGVLTAPGAITQSTADRIKAYWDTNFTGENYGKVAVLGDGLKYEAMTVNAHDAQLIEQLKWTAEMVCMCFGVPAYMIGAGPPPNYNNIEALNAQYYAQCLQSQIESVELALDEGLELPKPYGVEFDLDDLLRMDTATLIKSEKEAGGLKKVNESRKRLGLPAIPGGDTVFRQQQDFSLEALNRRDAQETPPPVTSSAPAPALDEGDAEDKAIRLLREKAAAAGWLKAA
jgi:HK97 family phage portal protein